MEDRIVRRPNGEKYGQDAQAPLVLLARHDAKTGPDRPSRAEAEAAVRTLIRWAGDDPGRDGLRDTPTRVARAYEEWFGGYKVSAADLLERTFDEIGGYRDPVLLRDIPVHSCCEHHMAPIAGKAHIAYQPAARVAGLSKIVRVVEAFSRRLQIQERLTDEIANAIDGALKPLGVAVVIDAEHACMSSRGVRVHGTRTVTRRLLGTFAEDGVARREFLSAIGL